MNADGTGVYIWSANECDYFVQNLPDISPLSVGDTVRAEIEGDTVRLYVNDVLVGQVTNIVVSEISVPNGPYGGTMAFIPEAPFNGTMTIGNVQVGTFAPPSIALINNLWYFGYGNSPPAAFNLGGVSATLTANGVTDGTYDWTVANGASKLAFENGSTTITKTNVNTVGILSRGYSTVANDVTVSLRFTPPGGTAIYRSYILGIDSPYELLSDGDTMNTGVGGTDCHAPPPGTDGFQSLVPYKIYSLFANVVSNIDINETFSDLQDDYTGNSWPVYSAGNYTTPDGGFVDNICVLKQINPPFNPLALPPQSPLGTTKIDHGSQAWFVGSLTEASGVQVQSNTLQRYQDHAVHLNVTSPVR